MRNSRRCEFLLCIIALVTACSSSTGAPLDTSSQDTKSESVPTASFERASTSAASVDPTSGCDATPTTISDDGTEVQGVSSDASVYGLLFQTHEPPIRQGDELKIVWRMTGQGDLLVSYTDPNGQAHALVFGPEPHSGSTYTRPGDEWGTGFTFDQPGCWHIHLQRDTGVGDVWLTVAPGVG